MLWTVFAGLCDPAGALLAGLRLYVLYGGCVEAPSAFLRPRVGSLSVLLVLNLRDCLPACVCALPLHSQCLFWLAYTRTHCRHTHIHIRTQTHSHVRAIVSAEMYVWPSVSWLSQLKWNISLPKSFLLSVIKTAVRFRRPCREWQQTERIHFHDFQKAGFKRLHMSTRIVYLSVYTACTATYLFNGNVLLLMYVID